VEYEFEYPDGPFQVILRTWGPASVQVFTELNGLLQSDTRITDGTNMLFDHSQLDMSGMTTDQIRTIASNTGGDYQGRGGRIAIVMPQPSSFGLGRMWQSMTGDQISARARVVDSVDEAYRWLETDPA
jgi:hypothetical protein